MSDATPQFTPEQLELVAVLARRAGLTVTAEEVAQMAVPYYAQMADVAKLYAYPFGFTEPVITYSALP